MTSLCQYTQASTVRDIDGKKETGDAAKRGAFLQFCHTNCAEISLSALAHPNEDTAVNKC